MDPAQQRRRREVIEVATRLCDEGFDAVRMKQVAEESKVSLATLYNWFTNKNLLVLEVMAEWLDEIVARVEAEGPVGGSVGDQVEATLLRTVDLAFDHPARMRACIHAFSTPEPMGFALAERVEFAFGRLLFVRMGDEVDVGRRVEATRMIGGVWFASLNAWACERRDEQHVRDMLSSAVRVSLVD